MPSSNIRLMLAVWGVLLFSAPAAPAWSQTAGQIAPPSFRPAGPPSGPGTLSPAREPDRAAAEEGKRLTVRIGRITVEGARPELGSATSAIISPLEGSIVTAAVIFEAARAIETAYADAGFVLTRVVVPPQTLTDGGTTRLVVVDGAIAQVDITAPPASIRRPVGGFLAPLEGRPGLLLSQIERSLLLAGDTPGSTLRSTLAPGEAPGTTRLVLDARQRPITGFLSYDNTLSKPLGNSMLGFGLEANSLMGFGELFYLRASGYPGRETFDNLPLTRAIAAGVVWPIGFSGLNLNLEATQSLATPRKVADAVNFTSDFQRYSARLRYPVRRERSATLYVEAALEAQSERLESITPFSSLLSYDDLRVARLSADGFAALAHGRLVSGRVTFSQGLSALGARQGTAAIPLSRQGAESGFSRLEAAARLDQPLLTALALQVTLRAQTSFGQPLVSSEQFGLVTAIGLSAFDSGRLQGDSGYVARAELQSPRSMPAGSLLIGTAPYLYVAAGMASLTQPTALERPKISATSWGLGLRLGAAQAASTRGLTVSLEYGLSNRSDLSKTQDRVTVAAMLRF